MNGFQSRWMYVDDCLTSSQCLQFIQSMIDEKALQKRWSGMGLADKYIIVNNEEYEMGKMKELSIDLQEQADRIAIEEPMSQEEMDDTIDQIMKDEADAQDRLFKAEKRYSFIKGFFAGWAFVVILNLLSYLI